jgi:hypothetical protein
MILELVGFCGYGLGRGFKGLWWVFVGLGMGFMRKRFGRLWDWGLFLG